MNNSHSNASLDGSFDFPFVDFGIYQNFLDTSNTILKYFSIIVVIFGTIFNLINFFCFYQMKKRNSQNIYLIFLSLADLYNIQINITVPLIRNVLSEGYQFNKLENGQNTKIVSDPVLGIPTQKWKHIFCTLDGYLVEIGLLLPAWIMVILAAERFIIIMWPLRKNVKNFYCQI